MYRPIPLEEVIAALPPASTNVPVPANSTADVPMLIDVAFDPVANVNVPLLVSLVPMIVWVLFCAR